MVNVEPIRLPVDSADHDAPAVIDGCLHWTDASAASRPSIVICHGFKGFMDWGFFPYLAELLAARGFGVVRFNFSGGGHRPGEDRVSDLEAFRANTHSRELCEVLAVVEALGDTIGAGVIDGGRVGLVGHSRGGGAALLAAAHESVGDRIRALVTWAAVGTYDRYFQHAESWREAGERLVVNGRTGQELPLGVGLLEDIERHGRGGGRLDLEAAARRVEAPWLIVHGTEDEAVPLEEAHLLASANTAGPGPHAALHEIDGAGHTFGAKHPFAGPTPDLTNAMNATQKFMRRYLR